MKYDLLLMRLDDRDNPLTEEERQWVHKQATTSRLVEALYIEHTNKIEKRQAKKENREPIEIVQFHVSLGDEVQNSSIFEILQALLMIDTSKKKPFNFKDQHWVE